MAVNNPAGASRTVTVDIRDVCSDRDCSGCCSANTGGGRWPMIDLEKVGVKGGGGAGGESALPVTRGNPYRLRAAHALLRAAYMKHTFSVHAAELTRHCLPALCSIFPATYTPTNMLPATPCMSPPLSGPPPRCWASTAPRLT